MMSSPSFVRNRSATASAREGPDPLPRSTRGFRSGRAAPYCRVNPDKPSFVNLWLDDPHTPWVPSADDQKVGKDGAATGKGDTKERLRGVMVQLDRQVGKLLDALRAARAGRPTIVLFLSDNGPLPSFDRERTVGLQGSKLSLYEGGVRLPFIAWGPGIIPAKRNRIIDEQFVARRLLNSVLNWRKSMP